MRTECARAPQIIATSALRRDFSHNAGAHMRIDRPECSAHSGRVIRTRVAHSGFLDASSGRGKSYAESPVSATLRNV